MENLLYYTKPAKHFEEALPLGNGRLGATVYGNVKKEKIALNEDTLWSGYPMDSNKKDAGDYLEKVRAALFQGRPSEAESIMNKNMHGTWSASYLPFGNLIIDYKSRISKKNYKRTLDISKGISKTECAGITETVFVSYPAQLIVVHLESNQEFSCEISFESQLKSSVSCREDSLVISGSAPEICYPPYYKTSNPIQYGTKGMKFTGIAKVLGNAVFSNDRIAVHNQKEITILVSLATSYIDFKTMPTANSYEKAAEPLKKLTGYTELLNAHIADFSSLFDRVELTLNGSGADKPTNKRIKAYKKGSDDYALIALLFQFGRYLTISGSRAGTTAMNLQGIWNEHMRAPWSSNYTININTQMNYWGTDAANLSECFSPLTELVKKLSVNGRETAKAYYNCSGYCAHHNTDIWGFTLPASNPEGKGNDAGYAYWQAGVPWFLNMLYDHYEYTKDEAYKEEIMPLFEGNLQFYKDFLVEKDGELVTCPSLSPENSYNDNGTKANLTYMPSMDREILHDFFMNCKRLGLDAPEIKQAEPASDGRIPEWIKEYGENEIHHRHVSHLYCIYPSAFEASEELQRAADQSLKVRGDGGTGWSLAWKVCLRARMKQPDKADVLLRNQLNPVRPFGQISFVNGGGTYPNMLCAHPPFQIDGNFGVMAGIAEMIVNNSMPKSWNGRVKGIKCRNGETIDAEIRNGKLVK